MPNRTNSLRRVLINNYITVVVCFIEKSKAEMDDFDIKSQLDLLNEYLDREMEEIQTEYFVIKPDGETNGGNRPTTADNGTSTSIVNRSHHDYDKDRLNPDVLEMYSWQKYKNNKVWFPQMTYTKRSRAIDIIDPETGEKIQL
ncbi:Uncharacterized protein FWK35_00015180 [Aphis craccivora]|uniref:Uncharacterized protein n=1 Tax=Aphis craccivora TaxID=307492 RepID=A0A6G0Z3D6_APHCR|nr:Uncharacterized protein FWK35_00015180 [Aphis craccivora]